MKIENVEVYGFRSALRGMRNPLESWDRSDTTYAPHDNMAIDYPGLPWDTRLVCAVEEPTIGPNDMKLILSLIRGGGAHRKFLRQIAVVWDISIPRMIWQEYDTYKVATVRNSCSTMHKLGSRDLEPCDLEGYEEELDRHQLDLVNRLGAAYRENKTAENLHRLKLRVTEAFVQKSTCTFNYETALHMYFDRKDHRMPEWSGPDGICEWILVLPYMDRFVGAMLEAKARG
jgi:hypothetical protein